MRHLIRSLLVRLLNRLRPKPDRIIELQERVRAYQQVLSQMPVSERGNFVRFSSFAAEMIEARLMAGAGPGFAGPSAEMIHEADDAIRRIHDRALGLREAGVTLAGQGAFGDIELALQNVEWRREINLSWLEFSRWGIQQIILISRLYYIKNPLLRRAIDVCSAYVFGRGVEVTSTDDSANDVLKEFFERNKKVFGMNGMLDNEKRKYYDGNLFFAIFADAEDTGETNCRLIDATEVQEVVTDPEDGDREILYKRIWTYRDFDAATGRTQLRTETRWYPAIGVTQIRGGKPATIGSDPIDWTTPVYHRVCGNVAKWTMGCPIIYPAIAWAKTSTEYLEACLTVAQSHAQIAWNLTTKGGQAALEGMKQQLQTTVNASPSNSLWDTNPPATDASIFGSGPGTTLAPVMQRGKGINPAEVKEYRNMVGMVVGIPPTWLGDMETANLSTATTLDRPTELGFRAKQVQWEEDLIIISKFVLETSGKAANGKLREAWRLRDRDSKVICITEAPRKTLADGRRVYDEAAKPADDEIQVRVTFPAIREGDVPALIKAIVEAMTLDNKGGQIVGIDEREGVRLLFEQLGVEDIEEILDKMYPLTGKNKYDPNRTIEPLPAPIGRALPGPGGVPQLPGGKQPGELEPGKGPQDKPVVTATERLVRALESYRARIAS